MLGEKDVGSWEGTCLILESLLSFECTLRGVFVCMSSPYVLLMHYLTSRFTYFLGGLANAVFVSGTQALCDSIWKCTAGIYRLPPRNQSITTIAAHCSQRADLHP